MKAPPESTKASLECAARFHYPNESAQNENEDNNVDGLNRAGHHPVSDISNACGVRSDPLIGAWH